MTRRYVIRLFAVLLITIGGVLASLVLLVSLAMWFSLYENLGWPPATGRSMRVFDQGFLEVSVNASLGCGLAALCLWEGLRIWRGN